MIAKTAPVDFSPSVLNIIEPLNVTTSFVSLKMHAISLLGFRLLWLTWAELLVDVFNRLHQAAVDVV